MILSLHQSAFYTNRLDDIMGKKDSSKKENKGKSKGEKTPVKKVKKDTPKRQKESEASEESDECMHDAEAMQCCDSAVRFYDRYNKLQEDFIDEMKSTKHMLKSVLSMMDSNMNQTTKMGLSLRLLAQKCKAIEADLHDLETSPPKKTHESFEEWEKRYIASSEKHDKRKDEFDRMNKEWEETIAKWEEFNRKHQ